MTEKVFLKECNVKKTNQYDALDVLKYFSLGTPLYLFREPEDNKECVFLYYFLDNEIGLKKPIEKNVKENLQKKNNDNPFLKIGVLSEEDEDPIDKFLKARQTEEDIKKEIKTEKNEVIEKDMLFECKVSSIVTDVTDADEDKRIKVAIFIKKSDETPKAKHKVTPPKKTKHKVTKRQMKNLENDENKN